MKILGAVILVLSALLLARGYKSFVREGVRQAEAFLELICGLKRHISVSGAPIDRFVSGEDNPTLRSLGFYGEYSARGSLCEAFDAVRSRLCLPKGIARTVGNYFREVGRCDLSTEVRRAENGAAELKAEIEEYKTEAERSVRVVSVVLVAAALGTLIAFA